MTATTETLDALREAGRAIALGGYDAAGIEYLEGVVEEGVQMQGDIDYLDEVARAHGLEDGMPYGYLESMPPEWEAVMEGVEEEYEALKGTPGTGRRIAHARAEKGWTQQRLADMIACSQSQVADWERGARVPGTPNLILLARALEVSVDWLLGLD